MESTDGKNDAKITFLVLFIISAVINAFLLLLVIGFVISETEMTVYHTQELDICNRVIDLYNEETHSDMPHLTYTDEEFKYSAYQYAEKVTP